MKANDNLINRNANSKWVGVGLLAAITASLCCITPVLALLSGVSGIAATFSWMEPIRPFLIAFAIAVLGFAWYQKLKPRRQEEINCSCEEDEKDPFIQSKSFLAIVTAFAIIMLAFPSYSHIFYPKSNKSEITSPEISIQQLNLEVKGMTCSSCEEHVKFAVSQMEGILQAEASFETGTAIIQYDQSVVSKDEVIEAVNKTGYQVTKTEEIQVK